MREPSTKQILSLVSNLLLPFHEVKRQHKLPIGRHRLENDVEHSWTVSILACALAEKLDQGLDIGKVAQFALVHDLVEVFAGDTRHFSASSSLKANKKERERNALKKIKSEYSMFPWLGQTITAYESMDCEEAAFVYSVDKYIAVIYDLLDKGLYLQQICLNKAQYDELMEVHRVKAHRHPLVGKYYDDIRTFIDHQPEFMKNKI
jgi:putative hydrolase of HD superfamily